MSKTTSTVTHNLTLWSVEELTTRIEHLELLTPKTYEQAISASFTRFTARTSCNCEDNGEFPCTVNDTNAIDRELATR